MKTIIRSTIILTALLLGAGAWAAVPFTPGNLVIYRVGGDASGNTAGTLTNRGNIVWLDEYTTDGVTRVQSIMMPQTYYGANSPLTGVGTTFGNGLITRSVDGRFILICGYGAVTNQFAFSLQSAFGTEAPRIIGLVDGNAHIDTTTAQTNQLVDGEEMRAATSPDGTNLWFSGSAGGVRYTQRGSPLATNLVGGNIRQLNIFNNQLYFTTVNSSNSFLQITNNVPGTLPTSSNNVVSAGLPGVTNNIPFFTAPEAFVMFKLHAGGTDPLDTLYIADAGTNSASGRVLKFCLAGGTWSNDGSIRASGATGLTGQTRITGSTTNVDLWIVQNTSSGAGNDNLLFATDTTGFQGVVNINANINVALSSATSVSFRGIAFAPTTVGDETFPTGPQNLSVGPILDFISTGSTGCSATETDLYSIANFGTGTMTWQALSTNWVTITPSSGSLGAGGSITVAASFNAGVTSLATGTNTTTITFTNTTVGSSLGTQTRAVSLVMKDQSITPTTDYTPAGQVKGPFTPATNTYTLFNGSTPIHLVVSTNSAVPWLSINTTDIGSLSGCSSTNIVLSIIPGVATNLANGNYTTVVTFSNATVGAVIGTRNVQLSVGGLFFCDDFSTYTQNANLVPQQGWTAVGSGNEPFVTNNAVYVKAVVGGSADEPFKNIPITSNGFVYAGMVMTITSAPPVSTVAPSRMVCFFNQQNEGNFAVHYLSVRDTGTGTFQFCARANSFSNYLFDVTARNYGQSYRVILQADVTTSNTLVYIDPVSSTLDTSTADINFNTHDPGGAANVNIGCFSIQNTFASSTIVIPGVAFNKICITTNYAEAFNDISAAPPSDPFTTWQNQYFGCTNCAQAQGGADPFGKGMSNTNQFLAGFDPTNKNAYVHIVAVAATNSSTNIRVDYLGASGNSSTTPAMGSRTNVLEFTAGTAGGNYNSNGFASAGVTNILSGGVGLGTLTNMVDSGGATNVPSRYYRVRVLVP